MARQSYKKQARATIDRMKAEREGKEPPETPGEKPDAEDAAETNPLAKKKPTPK